MPSIYSDARGRIVDIDKAALVELGWSRDAVIGTQLADHLDDDAQGAFARTWLELVGEPDAERTYSALVKSGTGQWLAVELFDTNLLDDPNYEAVRTEVEVEVQQVTAPAPVAKEPSRSKKRSAKRVSTAEQSGPVAEAGVAPSGAAVATIERTEESAAEPAVAADADPGPDKQGPAGPEAAARPQIDGARILEFVLIGAVALFAVISRLWDLSTLPAGLHGDEAITGLEGVRVLNEGSIGVYTGSALGQPTAPFYITAISVGLFGESIFAVRLVSALVGVATVVLLYFVVRRRLGPAVGVASAGVLATMTWHLHYSRIAFGVIWWPLLAIAAIAAVDRAIETRSPRWWAAAGATTAFGVYIYNAHWILGFAIGLFVVIWALTNRADVFRGPTKDRLKELGAFAGGGLLTLLPMLRYISDESNAYGNHAREVSMRNTPDWIDAGFGGKVGLLIERYIEAWNTIVLSRQLDASDGSGIVAPVSLLITLAALVGLWIIFTEHRNAFTGLVVTVAAILPFAPVLTVRGHGWMRRQLPVAPMIAIAAGVALVYGYRWLRTKGEVVAWVGVAIAVIVLAGSSWRGYFGTFEANSDHQWTFLSELSEPIALMDEYSDEAFINFYSPRHPIGYESVTFLAPDIEGTDRSDQFSDQPGFELTPGVEGSQLFVMVANYAAGVDFLALQYPEGEVVAQGLSGGVPYSAYLVPR